MNQILVSEKLYVTPDMKKKKVAFRLQFILSVFLLCILSSCYIYAETDNIQKTRTKSGTEYYTIGVINIPKINVNYPILSETSDELLKIAPCKFWGPNPNQKGNLCIVAHNYRNSKFFSKIPTLENGDYIEITDLSGRTITYEVFDKYTITPDDLECTSQLVGNEKHVTLITCTNDSKHRWVIKAKEKLD